MPKDLDENYQDIEQESYLRLTATRWTNPYDDPSNIWRTNKQQLAEIWLEETKTETAMDKI